MRLSLSIPALADTTFTILLYTNDYGPGSLAFHLRDDKLLAARVSADRPDWQKWIPVHIREEIELACDEPLLR